MISALVIINKGGKEQFIAYEDGKRVLYTDVNDAIRDIVNDEDAQRIVRHRKDGATVWLIDRDGYTVETFKALGY